MPEYERIIENVTLDSTLRLTGSEWSNTLVRNVTIENIDGDGVMLRDVENVRLENVTIRNVTGDGIKLSTLGSTSDVVIADSVISGIGEDGINAGQRFEEGVDHPGLQIIGNQISATGLNGGQDGLRHGIYVQSTDVEIRDNRISDSQDGNGISVRSSGIVSGNFVENSNGSGIAYFADHMGSGGTLTIEDNTVEASGYGRGRSDIDLLSVPDMDNLIGQVIVRDNALERGAEGVRIGQGYDDVAVTIDANGTDTVAARPSVQPVAEVSVEGDSISLTAGDDILHATSGADVFVIATGGVDRIQGFEPGIDLIDLRGVGEISRDDVAEWNGDTIIRLGDSDGLILKDTPLSGLSMDDFLFN